MTNRRLALLGAFVALAIPMSSILVAVLWDHGILEPDPNGPFVQAVQSLGPYELILGPAGVAVAGRAAGLRQGLSWIALVIWAAPALAVIWLLGAIYLGGLAGEPF